MIRSRPFVVALTVVSVLLVASFVYVQTSAGFRQLVVPLANAFVPGTLEARGGSLGLGGTLEAQGLRFDAPELGVTVSVEELELDLSLGSVAFGDRPHLNRLRLVGAEIALVPPPDAPEEEPAAEKDAEAFDLVHLIPLSIAEAEIRELKFSRRDANGAQIEVGPLELKVSRLVAGETGEVELTTALGIQGPENVNYVEELKLAAEITHTPGGELEGWTAAAEAGITGVVGSGETFFSLGSDGSIGDDDIELSTTLRAERAGSTLGEAKLLATTSADSEGRESIGASLELRSITEEFINPLIAPLGRGEVAHARIDGKLDVVADAPIDFSKIPRRATGELSIGRLDYRTLKISKARAKLDAGPGNLAVELLPTQVSRGRISGSFSLETRGEEEHLEVALKTLKLDLTAISRAFREDLPAAIDGVLDLTVAVSSQAPAGTDVRERAQGSVRTDLKGGRIEGFNIMGFLAAQSGVEAFKAIPLDDFDVDATANIRDGVAHLNEAAVRSTATQMLVNGTVALMGSLDLTIEAFVGPGVTGTLKSLGIEIAAVTTAERLTAVPVAIGVSGPFSNLSYGPAAPRTGERTTEAVGSGGDTVNKAAEGVKGLFRKMGK